MCAASRGAQARTGSAYLRMHAGTRRLALTSGHSMVCTGLLAHHHMQKQMRLRKPHCRHRRAGCRKCKSVLLAGCVDWAACRWVQERQWSGAGWRPGSTRLAAVCCCLTAACTSVRERATCCVRRLGSTTWAWALGDLVWQDRCSAVLVRESGLLFPGAAACSREQRHRYCCTTESVACKGSAPGSWCVGAESQGHESSASLG